MSKIFLVLSLLMIAAPSVVYADMPGFSSTGVSCKVDEKPSSCPSMTTCKDGTCK